MPSKDPNIAWTSRKQIHRDPEKFAFLQTLPQLHNVGMYRAADFTLNPVSKPASKSPKNPKEALERQ